MNYAYARLQIRSGDLIAWSHYQWASWYDLQVQAVRVFTESEYSHVALAWVVGGRVFAIESVEPVIRIVPLSNLLGTEGCYWSPLGLDISDQELEFALSKVGNGAYSKLEAIASQLGTLQIGQDDLWSCAEFFVAARRLSGRDLGPKATPAAVVAKVQEKGYPLYRILPNINESKS